MTLPNDTIVYRKMVCTVLAAIAFTMVGLWHVVAADPVSAAANEGDAIRAVYDALPPQAQPFYYQQSEKLTKAVPARLIELDQLTIGCFAPETVMGMPGIAKNLGGQCCGVLTTITAYDVQLEALRRLIATNGPTDLIPRDPYDVPVAHAQRLLAFDQAITLNTAQQHIYDQAVENSHHGGPCCCKCWKWYTMSGLAKQLIVDNGWNTDQIAELWDTSSSCGHAHDTDIHQHYHMPENDHAQTGHEHHQ